MWCEAGCGAILRQICVWGVRSSWCPLERTGRSLESVPFKSRALATTVLRTANKFIWSVDTLWKSGGDVMFKKSQLAYFCYYFGLHNPVTQYLGKRNFRLNREEKQQCHKAASHWSTCAFYAHETMQAWSTDG